ncbi:MAG: hypothetical protein H6766_07130 [Candidatus Peribacteria bacterium]|nr:MAG: hypothetical protein H6766_07130 [Candidatus Peribacteria bacterium]
MLHKKHKDILIRLLVGLISGAYVGYIAWLIATGNTDVTGQTGAKNYILIGLCLIVALLFAINTLYKPLIQKRIRLTLSLIGLGLIVLAHYTMLDNPETYLYLADLTKLFGVLILVGGATEAIIPTDVVEKIQESKIEIIEA